MSASADKARYFLEQSVPELKEFERKKIFSREEISTIAKKRSDFEHKINARGSSPKDYVQYAEFEINLDSLRKKRVKRLAIRGGTTYHGPRRIFFVLDRGTRKFPGDLGLWFQTIDFARRQKSHKKVTQTLTNALRLHPTKPDLWIYAARFAMEENGDMTEARSYMQRGLRFCKTSRKLWAEYLRLEMAYITKIHLRREILGIGGGRDSEDGEKTGPNEESSESFENGGSFLQLSATITKDFISGGDAVDEVDQEALAKLNATPVMSGAIPIAIVDAALKQFQNDTEMGLELFEVVAGCGQLPISHKILQHIDQLLSEGAKDSWQAHACHISLLLFAVDVSSPEFPGRLRTALQTIRSGADRSKRNPQYLDWCRNLLDGLLAKELDPALQAVLASERRRLE